MSHELRLQKQGDLVFFQSTMLRVHKMAGGAQVAPLPVVTSKMFLESDRSGMHQQPVESAYVEQCGALEDLWEPMGLQTDYLNSSVWRGVLHLKPLHALGHLLQYKHIE